MFCGAAGCTLTVLIWQVMNVLRFLADVFNTESLDPSVWMATISGIYEHMCSEAPAQFIGVELLMFVLIALAILYEADFSRWRREADLRAQGYRQLDVDDDGPTDEGLEKLYNELDEDGGGSIDNEEMSRCESERVPSTPLCLSRVGICVELSCTCHTAPSRGCSAMTSIMRLSMS